MRAGGNGPPHARTLAAPVLHAGYTVLRSGPDGSISADPEGLYDYDARILSRYRLLIDDEPPELLEAVAVESDVLVARYRHGHPAGRAAGPRLPEDALDIDLRRVIDGGMLDRWRLVNRSAEEWRGRVRLEVDADFADVAEVGGERRQRGQLAARLGARSIELRYTAGRDGRRLTRGVRVRLVVPRSAGGAVDVADGNLTLDTRLAPGGEVEVVIRVGSLVDGSWRSPSAAAEGPGSAHAGGRAAWRASRLRVDGPERLARPADRAIEDLFALRNGDLEAELLRGPDGSRLPGWIVNAGVPSFTGYFGRDTLTAGWQSAMAGTAALRGALEVAASTQATGDDPWRDAEPGKMLHELRRGPLSILGLSPRDAYYGSQTTPVFFVVALSELWHWTGDERLLRRFREPALRALEWAERATDERGFVAYLRRSPAGLANQGWKDSDEAIRHADGRLARPPIATVEEQAFHFLALQRLAEILVALGDEATADALRGRAETVRRRWHDAFWMPRERFYALALDADGRQVESIASNPGHALATGIVPAEHAREVADRLLSPELFGGWGVRTLSTGHPSYNPLAYHLGAVWPVENATFALGLRRYGLDAHLDRLATAMLEAAAASPGGRLPEALTGHERAPGIPPIPYPGACSPQAWSASAVIATLQLLLGLYPFAPLGVLTLVRPRLPRGVPALTLRGLRVGRATADIRFTRRDDGTAAHKVLRADGPLRVVPVGPPTDAPGTSPSLFEAAGRALLGLAPGRLAKAARIAVGRE